MNEITGTLDPGIADVVHLLRRNRINTFASCQGGEGHSYKLPTIRIHPTDPEDMQLDTLTIARVLSVNGYHGYYIKQYKAYQNSRFPWKPDTQSFIEVEFWSDPIEALPRLVITPSRLSVEFKGNIVIDHNNEVEALNVTFSFVDDESHTPDQPDQPDQ